MDEKAKVRAARQARSKQQSQEKVALQGENLSPKAEGVESASSGGGGGGGGGQGGGSNKSSRWSVVLGASAAMIVAIGFASTEIKANPDGTLGKIYSGSALERFVNWIHDNTVASWNENFLPDDEPLLPDYVESAAYPGAGSGAEPPPALILDVENTLIGQTYDAKYGWRYVKRPGLDNFITKMAQYYEIVLISEEFNIDVLEAIDPNHCCHKKGQQAMEVRNGIFMKRLDLANRPLSKVILIDDSPECAQLFPRNTLFIKPFLDVHDKDDTALDDLLALLMALQHERVDDYRDCFDKLSPRHDAEEAAVKYRMLVHEHHEQEREKRNKGLAWLLKNNPKDQQPKVGDKTAEDDDEGEEFSLSKLVKSSPSTPEASSSTPTASPSSNPTGKKEAPGPVVKKKGKLFQMFDESEKEAELQRQRKEQRMQEIWIRKQKEAADEEAKKKRQQAGYD